MEEPMEQMEEKPDGKRVTGGCQCTTPRNGGSVLLLLLGLLLIRRQRSIA